MKRRNASAPAPGLSFSCLNNTLIKGIVLEFHQIKWLNNTQKCDYLDMFWKIWALILIPIDISSVCVCVCVQLRTREVERVCTPVMCAGLNSPPKSLGVSQEIKVKAVD